MRHSSRIWIAIFILSMNAARAQITPSTTEGDQSRTRTVDKLMMFNESVDYERTLANGTLAPDKVWLGEHRILTGMTETALVKRMGSSYKVTEPLTSRTLDEHRAYLDDLNHQHADSMHYYILADIFYNRRLHGDFKVYEWGVQAVGRLRVYLHRSGQGVPFRTWLLHLTMDPVAPDTIEYRSGGEFTLFRAGDRSVEWQVTTNVVRVDAP